MIFINNLNFFSINAFNKLLILWNFIINVNDYKKSSLWFLQFYKFIIIKENLLIIYILLLFILFDSY